jgi:hypothetical protein
VKLDEVLDLMIGLEEIAQISAGDEMDVESASWRSKMSHPSLKIILIDSIVESISRNNYRAEVAHEKYADH